MNRMPVNTVTQRGYLPSHTFKQSGHKAAQEDDGKELN